MLGVCPTIGAGPLDALWQAHYRRGVNFQQALQEELEQRRERNPRYSLRAFARYLGTDHSTLSQILRRRRTLSAQMMRRLAGRLRLSPGLLNEACAQHQAETVLRLVGSRAFRPDSRWLAIRTGLQVDAVNAALHRLLHQGQLVMKSSNHWSATRAPYA